MLIIALIAGRGAEDPAISVVTILTDSPSGLDSQKRLSLWLEAAGLVCALQFWDKTGSGGRRRRGSKRVQKGWGVKQTPKRGEKGIERPTKITCNPAKSPLAMVSSHSHLYELRSSGKKCQVVHKFVPICSFSDWKHVLLFPISVGSCLRFNRKLMINFHF